MDASTAVRSSLRVLWRRPWAVLPAFLTESGAGVVAGTVFQASLAVAVLSLAGTGRIARLADAVDRLASTAADGPSGAPDRPDPAAVEALREAAAGLVTPTTAAVVGLGLLAAAAVGLVARAAVGAATVNAAAAAMADGRPTVAAVEGATDDLRPFVGLGLLRGALALLGAVAVGGTALVVAGGATTPAGAALGVGAALLVAVVLAPGALLVYLALLFVPEAIVVDDRALPGAVRANAGFVTDHPLRALTVLVVEFGLLAAVWSLGAVLNLLGMGRVGAVPGLLVVAPLVGLLKMGLYVEGPAPTGRPAPGATPASAPAAAPGSGSGSGSAARAGAAGASPSGTGGPDPAPDRGTVADRAGAPTSRDASGPADRDGPDDADPTDRLVGGARAVLADARWFLRTGAPYVALAFSLFVLGGAVGWTATAAYGIDPVGVDRSLTVGLDAVGQAANLAANNWLVAVGHSTAGLAFGLATVGNLLYNGLLVGALGGSGLLDVRLFVALVLPHGIIEVPAISVSGGLGLFLGVRSVRYLRGRTDAAALATALRRGVRVLAALAPVFVVAAVVEAFLTPLVGELVRTTVLP